MEPILVILLLFGAFTLGAQSADSHTTELMAPVSRQQSRDAEGMAATLSFENCLSSRRPVLYRDLTIPFTRQQTALSAPVEPGCPDE